jgi:hypothetical protein
VVWRPLQDSDRDRQDRWRAGFIWGVFGLLVAAALGAQSFVPGALEVELGPQVHSGRLSVRMPAGWQLTEEGATLVAQSEAGRGQELMVSLLWPASDVSLSQVVATGFAPQVDEAAIEGLVRRVRVEGRPALLLSHGGVQRRLGGETEVHIVKLAFEPAPGTIAHVQLVSRGRWNTAAEVIVQQVARTIRVESEE